MRGIKIAINRRIARKVGLWLFEIGAAAFLIGGLSLDGPDLFSALALTVTALAVAAAGYILYRATDVRVPARPAVDADRLARRRSAVFKTWMENGTLKPELKVYK